VNLLVPYNSALSEPLEVAACDAQVYLVEEIIAHRGNPKNKEEMEFLVRWKGYSPADDTWEPYPSLEANWVFHEYARTHKLAKLIPPRFRNNNEVIRSSR
jgi:hypothetical protein